jgi:copper oxidase (laccase) domain-containing protein
MEIFPSNIACITSTKSDGNMGFRFGEADEVVTNRTQFLNKHGLSYEECIVMQSDHKDIIKIVNKETPEKAATSREDGIQADVLVTQEKDLVLMLTTADCQPVSFYDPKTKTIALAHISRHTLGLNLAQKTVGFLCENLGVYSEDLLIKIGPHIKKESYRFELPLQNVSPFIEPFIEEMDGFAHIDTTTACVWQLTKAGVTNENIAISDVNTATSPDHFSYYVATRDNIPDGRLATILAMQT